ncbi:hypothetical protein IMY05_C5320000100 [Salix suchowensis]|nr:hypothetical protein IMY05_C5320000100 [Salix suchowensis]
MVEEWEKDLVIKNKHNLKQLIVLMWDQVPLFFKKDFQLPWSHPKSGLPTALISKPALIYLFTRHINSLVVN